MSDLAFNSSGDVFDVPASVTGWRVRRLKPRGAPEVVYGRDGLPLTIPVESELDDLRRAVDEPGRYRLDPVDDDRKPVEGAASAYVSVVEPLKAVVPVAEAVARSAHDESISVMREAMRLNTELARAVIDRFPAMMEASAVLIRAADGAGIPARAPLQLAAVVEDDDDNDGDDEEPVLVAPAGLDINALVAQVVPAVVMGVMSGKFDMAKLGALFDWRKAVPTAPATRSARPVTRSSLRAPVAARQDAPIEASSATSAPSSSNDDGAALPPLDPAAMAHFLALQSALSTEEAAIAREVAADLTPGQMRTWFAELSALSVPDAVARIRASIGTGDRAADGGAS